MKAVTIRTFDNYIDANIISGKLQAEGITCFLADEYTATINPFLSNAIGGIKLNVPEAEAAKARELLLSFDEEEVLPE
jgi:hypothetical protein